MHMKRLYISFFLALLGGVLSITPALAFLPPLPSSFYGTVTANGNPVHPGTLVRALINGVQYAETHTLLYQGSSVYSLNIPGDDPSTINTIEGGKEGDIVHFEIENSLTGQTGVWHSGTNVEINLNVVLFYSYIPIIRNSSGG
jgi:hypothetical protein